ncbi:MAG TPA: hypothetical protein VFC00_07840 [Micromonosporaceae bacterium]|nr:hypothetical protein [Micromonosporaceae bacterium]
MEHRTPPPIALALVLAAVVVAVQALLVPMFAWPAANLAPRDLPVIVAGPAPGADAVAGQLGSAEPGAFEVSRAPDAAAADAALRDRQAYAAFVVGPDGVSLHTASAASPAVAALLTAAAQQLGAGRAVPVVDVVASDPDDPRGAGFASGFLPLGLTSMVAGILLVFLVRSRVARLVGLGAYALLAGLAGAAVLQLWLGLIPGDYLANAAVAGLFALAVSAAVAGLGAALGRPGIGLGVLLVFVFGIPLSAVSAAPELLPQPWGQFGQWLPVGAGATLLRSVAYFDGAGSAGPLWILAAWAAGGLALVSVGRVRV